MSAAEYALRVAAANLPAELLARSVPAEQLQDADRAITIGDARQSPDAFPAMLSAEDQAGRAIEVLPGSDD